MPGGTPVIAPTVDFLVTASTTPTITGTYDSFENEGLEITVNSITYIWGTDPDLTTVDDIWTLIIPVANAIPAGTYDVIAMSIDVNLSTPEHYDETTDELTITATECPALCTTLRQVLNNVLVNLREVQIDPTLTALEDSYHFLLRNFFNQFLGEVQDAHNWGTMLKTCSVALYPRTVSGRVELAGECIRADARLARLPVPMSGVYLPLAHDITDPEEPVRLVEMDLHDVLRRQTEDNTPSQALWSFCLEPTQGVMLFRPYPLAASTRDIQLIMYVPQGNFEGDATDLDDCIALPARAIRALEIAVTWYALEERGEELGTSSLFTEQRYRIALDAAIVQDDTEGTGDNNQLVVT